MWWRGEHEPCPPAPQGPSETGPPDRQACGGGDPRRGVLSLGVGGVPFTVALCWPSPMGRTWGHTGTISDAFLELWKAGKLTNARKEVDRGGPPGIWLWALRSCTTGWTRSPSCSALGMWTTSTRWERISRMSNVISINGGVEVDLMGQENRESAGTRQLSGIGGQMDFSGGAYRSKGGKGFVCLNATHKKKDGTLKSTSSPCIAGGSIPHPAP